MEQRISRLGQFINEAQWRFQLVSWNNGTNNHKTRNSRRRLSRKRQWITGSEELSWKAEAAQDEDSDDTLTEGMAGKNGFMCLMELTTKSACMASEQRLFQWHMFWATCSVFQPVWFGNSWCFSISPPPLPLVLFSLIFQCDRCLYPVMGAHGWFMCLCQPWGHYSI